MLFSLTPTKNKVVTRLGSKNFGLSLIEVVVAIAILGIAVMFYFPVFSQSISFTKEIRDYSVILSLAEEIIHENIIKINENESGTAISFFEQDITEDVKSSYPNKLYSSFQNFKVFGTTRPSLLCENGGYEIGVKINWTVEGKKKNLSLFTVKAAP